MIKKEDFLEALNALVEISKTQQNEITKSEIFEYFSDMDLEDNQIDMILSYLHGKKITVTEDNEQNQSYSLELSKEDERYLKRYQEEIKQIARLPEEDRVDLFRRLGKGDATVKNAIIEDTLPSIVEMAKAYVNKGILVEDLIQEANLQCIYTVESLLGRMESDLDGILQNEIKNKILEMVDEEINYEDWESAVVAKTSLLHEATNYLAKELGRVANIHELSEYTKISEEEIKDIMKLTNDAVKVGKDC